MHCGRVSNLLSAYIDRELAGAEMLPIRRHLDACPGCAAELESLRRVKALLAGAPPPEQCDDPVEVVIRRWSEGRAAVSGLSERAPGPGSRWSWSWSWMYLPPAWQRSGLAVSALVVALALIATAAALRKPNYPDSLASNIVLSQPEERPPRSEIPYATVNWNVGPRVNRWPGTLGLRPPSMLVSDTFPSGGR